MVLGRENSSMVKVSMYIHQNYHKIFLGPSNTNFDLFKNVGGTNYTGKVQLQKSNFQTFT